MPERRTTSGRRATASVDRVRVYRMPAAQLLAALPDGSIDVIVTDPPYATVNRRADSGHLRDWFADSLTWPEIGRVLVLARKKLKPTGLLFLMANNDGMSGALAALQRAGFIGIRTVVWDRKYPGLGGGLRHRTEFILLGRLPGSRPVTGSDLVAVAAVGPGTANRYPTIKPDGLGRAIAKIAGIGPGDLVVDPFCGSGSLLVGPAERGATVVAGDVAARAVRLAAARLGAPVTSGRSGSPTGAGPAKRGPVPAPSTGPTRRAATVRRRTTVAARPATGLKGPAGGPKQTQPSPPRPGGKR